MILQHFPNQLRETFLREFLYFYEFTYAVISNPCGEAGLIEAYWDCHHGYTRGQRLKGSIYSGVSDAKRCPL
jgi:hypothetical protein